ncbi:MAG: hypothetical protein NTW40_08505 [Acidobacteria bacterium]|nr:hypothetical protein [Acidobacteriota bacterium]
MPDLPQESQAIPDQLMQIAAEQEGGAERVLDQIEVVQHSFEEIQTLSRECQEILQAGITDPGQLEALIARMEQIGFHADNGSYNIQGAFDLYQYQDVVRQKLERVGRSLIEVSHYVLARLQPQDDLIPALAPSGRDILHREPQMADATKTDADSVVAEFFATALKEKAGK